MKSNVFKKVLSIVIISLVLAITITTVVLALIPKRLYNPIADSYRYVRIYQKDNEQNNVFNKVDGSDEQKQVCTSIDENLKKSLKDNVLSSIFQGTGKYDESIVVSKTSSVETTIKGSTCLIFGWLEEQTLTINGEAYKTSSTDETVTYTELAMPIENDNDFQERVVYVLNSDGGSTYQIKFLAHQSDLYSYINGLSW